MEQCFKVWNYYLGFSRKFSNTCLMSDLLLPFLCYSKWSPELLKRVPRHICSWSVMLLVRYMSSELSTDVLSQDSCFSSVHSWHLTCSFICCWVNQRRMIVYNSSVREPLWRYLEGGDNFPQISEIQKIFPVMFNSSLAIHVIIFLVLHKNVPLKPWLLSKFLCQSLLTSNMC